MKTDFSLNKNGNILTRKETARMKKLSMCHKRIQHITDFEHIINILSFKVFINYSFKNYL